MLNSLSYIYLNINLLQAFKKLKNVSKMNKKKFLTAQKQIYYIYDEIDETVRQNDIKTMQDKS